MFYNKAVTSPPPLYHRIAEELRQRIELGELAPGEVLEPVRAAAARLGVNLHTVRHAYAELARAGLVESRRALGTRVVRTPLDPGDPAHFDERIERTCVELGISPRELHARLGARLAAERAERSVVWVVECSALQCEELAASLRARWDVDARPFPLTNPGEPQGSAVVATFFHYNELRVRWPHRLASAHFVTIRPDRNIIRHLGGSPDRRRTVVLAELDAPTLDAVHADVAAVLPVERFRIDPVRVRRPAELLRSGRRAPILFPPRLWSRLSPAEREDPRAHLLTYVFDPAELDALGAKLGLAGALSTTS